MSKYKDVAESHDPRLTSKERRRKRRKVEKRKVKDSHGGCK